MSDWLEVSLRVDGEAAEATADLLQRFGYQGVVIEQDDIPPDQFDDGDPPPVENLTLRAYIPFDAQIEDTKTRLEAALGHMSLMYPMPQPVYRTVADTDWSEAWKAHYHPLRIGRHFLIRPLWIEVEPLPDDLVIALDPGMAFGTGTHPTTHLCLEALEDVIVPGAKVLDLGCGSGILSIGAAKLGASHALGLDIDPIAVKAADENAEQNGVAATITAQEGSLATVTTAGQQFDVLVANILARIIIDMCGANLGAAVKPGGIGVFSGIIDEQAADVEAALRETGLQPYKRRQMGDWVVIEARKPDGDA